MFALLVCLAKVIDRESDVTLFLCFPLLQVYLSKYLLPTKQSIPRTNE